MDSAVNIRCPLEDDLADLGRRLGTLCTPRTVICLSGDLGAGKTVTARGIARGLGIEGRVPSPTYVIVQTLAGGRLPLWHGDLYRVSDEDELEQLGLFEMFEDDGVVVLEWAAPFAESLPSDRLELSLHIEPDQTRVVQLDATGPRHQALLEALGG